MSGQTGLEKGSNIKNLMKKHGIREALIKSAAVDGERFFVKTRFGKRRNTLCISRFSNRRIGGKDPSSAVGDLFRGSLGRLYMLGIQQATKMHQKKPEFHSYGPDMDLEQRQTQTGSSVRYRSWKRVSSAISNDKMQCFHNSQRSCELSTHDQHPVRGLTLPEHLLVREFWIFTIRLTSNSHRKSFRLMLEAFLSFSTLSKNINGTIYK